MFSPLCMPQGCQDTCLYIKHSKTYVGQENLTEKLLSYVCQMLEQISLNIGDPHPSSVAEPLEDVVGGDDHPETAINNRCHPFTNDLH